VGYVKTTDGFEVDFHARFPGAGEALIQVCAEPGGGKTSERELRALESARRGHSRAERILLMLNRNQVPAASGKNVRVQPAYEWLLDRESGR